MRTGSIIALLCGAIILGHTPAIIIEETAVTCEHREAGHVGRHGGQLEDDRFHRARGERVTCGDTKNDDGEGKADSSRDGSSDPTRRHGDDTRHDNEIPRRDQPGFHCTWHGCG